MPLFYPKSVVEESWKKLEPNQDYAFRAAKDDSIYLRLGVGRSYFISIVPTQFDARLMNSVGWDGEEEILSRLKKERIIIGRGAGANIKVAQPFVSRNHVSLHWQNNVLEIRDLGTLNGTYFHKAATSFNIAKYLEQHPLKETAEGTLDEMHELFGPSLRDYLIQYQNRKEQPQ